MFCTCCVDGWAYFFLIYGRNVANKVNLRMNMKAGLITAYLSNLDLEPPLPIAIFYF
jgi:hypothetical protein